MGNPIRSDTKRNADRVVLIMAAAVDGELQKQENQLCRLRNCDMKLQIAIINRISLLRYPTRDERHNHSRI